MTDTAKHTCPRRAEDGTDTADSPFVGAGPDQDTYTTGHGIIGQVRGCSYCGSMSPEDFMDAITEGAEVGPTDKNYKAYVYGYSKNGTNGGKFYFQHFSREQQIEFIELLNKQQVKIGYPGRFYIRPYFIAPQ